MMLSKLAAHLAPAAGRQDVASANPVLGDGISTNLHGNGEPACLQTVGEVLHRLGR